MSGKVFKAILYPLLIACIAAALYLFFYRNTWADDLWVFSRIYDDMGIKVLTNRT